MKILLVPEIAAIESSFVRPGEIQVVGYKEHLEDISRLLDAQDKLSAYDEDKERELFEAFWSENMNLAEMDLHRHIYPMDSGWSYACHETNRSWMTWKACAKSRARSAE